MKDAGDANTVRDLAAKDDVACDFKSLQSRLNRTAEPAGSGVPGNKIECLFETVKVMVGLTPPPVAFLRKW